MAFPSSRRTGSHFPNKHRLFQCLYLTPDPTPFPPLSGRLEPVALFVFRWTVHPPLPSPTKRWAAFNRTLPFLFTKRTYLLATVVYHCMDPVVPPPPFVLIEVVPWSPPRTMIPFFFHVTSHLSISDDKKIQSLHAETPREFPSTFFNLILQRRRPVVGVFRLTTCEKDTPRLGLSCVKPMSMSAFFASCPHLSYFDGPHFFSPFQMCLLQ